MNSKIWSAFLGTKGRTVQLTYVIRAMLPLLLLLTFIILFSSILQMYSSHKFYMHEWFPNTRHSISSLSYWWYQVKAVMTRLRWLVASLSQQRPKFTQSPVQSSLVKFWFVAQSVGLRCFFSPSTSVFLRQHHPTNAAPGFYNASNW